MTSAPPPPPPPSSQGPASPPGGADQPASVGEAFSYGWSKFQANAGNILLGLIVLMVISAIIGFIGTFLLGAVGILGGGSDGGVVASLLGSAAYMMLVYLLSALIQSGLIRAGLAFADGKKVDFQTLVSTEHIGSVILSSLLLSVGIFLGSILCIIPGLVVAFFGQFTLYFVVDKGMAPVDAIKASFELVKNHLGTLALFYVATMIATFAGALVCFVGLLVAFPVIVLATTYMYRRLQGEPVVA